MDRCEFPTLQPGDILKHCRVSLGMNFVTEEMVLRPSPDGIRTVYASFLQIAFNRREEAESYPEFLECSAPLVFLFDSLRRLFPALGCKESFLLRDLLCPDPKRARRFLSALINFLKFKTDEEVFGEHISGEQAARVSHEEFAKLKEEWTSVQSEIEKSKQKIESQRDAVSEKEVAIERLRTSKANIEKSRSQVTAAIEAEEAEVNTCARLLKDTADSIAERQERYKSMQMAIINPDKVIAGLKLAEDRLDSERALHIELEMRWKSLDCYHAKCTESSLRIKTGRSELELYQYSKVQLKELNTKIKARTEAILEEKRGIEMAGMRIAALQREVATGTQQTARNREMMEGRMQSLHAHFKSKSEDFASAKQRLRESTQILTKLQLTQCDIENRFRREEDAFKLKMNRTMERLETLNKLADAHYQWLCGVRARL